MSFPVPISFKDEEFAKITSAVGGGGDIREYIKNAALEKAESDIAKVDGAKKAA